MFFIILANVVQKINRKLAQKTGMWYTDTLGSP